MIDTYVTYIFFNKNKLFCVLLDGNRVPNNKIQVFLLYLYKSFDNDRNLFLSHRTSFWREFEIYESHL